MILLLLGCSPSADRITNQLNKLASSDLSDILNDMRDRNIDSVLSSEPSFVIHDFRLFKGDTARMFMAYAEVRFFYLKSIKLMQVRKYRYNTLAGIWERYDIKLKHQFPGKTSNKIKKNINLKKSNSGKKENDYMDVKVNE
ncbi:MAG: hypothetical protein HQK83_10515 [Fibrobacteria bacterium]|nr:hypothetical protein [Fibrobacteria bacterium]